MDNNNDSAATGRRSLLKAAGLAGLAGLGGAALAGRPAAAAMGKGPDELTMRSDGTYATVPLRQDRITLGVVQSRVRAVDLGRRRATLRDNVNHMKDLIDAAQGWGGRKDILQFHEFPITGFGRGWSREDVLQAAIEIPGDEVQEIADKAKEHNCYIVFGTYAKDEDWPGHVLNITVIVGPEGTIIDKHWKPRNIKGVFGPGYELYTTTIYDVLDEYVERYGRDAVIAVTRTDVGNICTTQAQNEPELIRAYAMKGAELMLRSATGGFRRLDVEAGALYNGLWTSCVNNAVSPGNPGWLEDQGTSGNSAIYDNGGSLVAEANSEHETIITARIPMAQYRARHRQPIVHMELYDDIFARYRNRYPPNLFSAYQPTDNADAYEYLKDKAVWAK